MNYKLLFLAVALTQVHSHQAGNHGGPSTEEPKRAEPPQTRDISSIDWNEIGFSYFNGRVFKTGSAEIKSVVNTRNTIAALLKIETVGLSGNAKLNICMRKAEGKKKSKIVKVFSMPLCDLPALNRKALMLTLGLKYIALPAQCPIPSGVFKLSYYYNSKGIDFFKGIPAGEYKIDFSITEDKNVLLTFFWRVIIRSPSSGSQQGPGGAIVSSARRGGILKRGKKPRKGVKGVQKNNATKVNGGVKAKDGKGRGKGKEGKKKVQKKGKDVKDKDTKSKGADNGKGGKKEDKKIKANNGTKHKSH